LFTGRHPDRRKTIFNQQLQHERGVSSVVLLFPRFGRADLRRMAHLTVDPQLFHQLQEPVHRTGGFDPHTSRSSKSRVKLSHRIAFVPQSLLDDLTCLHVQHGNRLLSRM
jgi:hypothetical protein